MDRIETSGPIGLAESVQAFRLSPQQRRLWKLQADGQPPAYRVACAVALDGELDRAGLRAALDTVVGRHEILRTVFRRLPDVELPLQMVMPAEGSLLREVDLTGLDPAEQGRRLDSLLDGMAWTPACLAAEPPLRLVLAALAPDRSALVIGLPALCADAAGLRNLVREIAEAYADGGSTPAEPPAQYADLAEWLNEMLDREDAQEERERWRRAAPAALDAVRLPFENPAPASGFVPRAVPVPLPDGLGERLAARAAERSTIAPVFLLACWSALLARWTDSSGMTVGTLFEGRSYEGLEEALGTFARFLPIGMQAEPGEPFAALLHRLDAAVREAHEIQEYFDGEGFDVIPFAFEHDEAPEAHAAGGVTFSPLSQRRACLDRFRLKLSGVQEADAVRLELQYDGSAFEGQDVERLAGQLRALLGAALDDPDTPLADLDLLPEAEERQILGLDAEVGSPVVGCVHHLFADQARRVPDIVAAVCGEASLTYAELNDRADRLAHALLRMGVLRGDRVASCLPRSLEVLVGLLGTLKAGAAFAPLDPQQPADRLALMLEDLGSPVLLTTAALAGSLPEVGARVIRLDEMAEMAEIAPADVEVGGEDLAYVIFTSGSTGRPKGVAVEHRQLFNYVKGVIARLDLPAGASFATVSTFAADLGHTMIFPSLCTGGTLHVIGEELLTDPEALGETFARRPVDCLKIVPSHLASLLASLPASASRPESLLPRLRLVLGGEACRPELIAAVRRLASPSCRIFNHYGPTETTVGVLTWPVPDGEDLAGALPLGRPIPGTRVYVADARLRPVPFRMAGELWIGGANVARGYLGRPDATAERFVPDPWGTTGARLYRTGDLARRRPDGAVEFLGRADDQVKLRGFRIEPGEIASLLLSHPAVAQAAVVLRDDGDGEDGGEPRLVAYWVPVRGAEAEPGDLRSFLAERLPAAMVPSAFVVLAELPLTRNGKLDRRALPAPRRDGDGAEGTYTAPRTPTEEILAGIWSEVLGVERVGIADDFFALGGHSLLATQVVSRVRRVFRIELPLRLLLDSPSVEALAGHVEQTLHAGDRPGLPPIVPVPRGGGLPLSFAQQRLWFLHQMEPDSGAYNIPAAVRLRGPLRVPAFAASLAEIVRRHESLRTTFDVMTGEPVQVIAPAGAVRLPVIDLSVLPQAGREAEVLRLVAAEAQRPFDLAQAPLLRATLLATAPDERVVTLTMHHIVSDGWSMGLLLRELVPLYQAFSAGRPSPLPEPALQYVDFAHWQRSWLAGEALDAELGYWRERLGSSPPVLVLPADRPRPAVQTFRGANLWWTTGERLAGDLHRLGRRQGATLFMTLLSAWDVLLHRHSGQDDFAIGSPIANRNHLQTEGMIGFFVNTLVLRADLSGDPSFTELLARVRETTLSAYTHQDLPFEKLVAELQPERNLSWTPLFQVMFALQNTPLRAFELPGVVAERVGIESRTAKFDLNLLLTEGEGGLSGIAEYNRDLFAAPTIQRLLDHFSQLLDGAVAHPERRLSELPLLTAAEARQILVDWNDTQAPYDRDVCLHELFEARVEQAPEAVAVAMGDWQLTYAELNRRANRLARHLSASGAGPGERVAVYLDRSPLMVIAVLGVLKSGAAYVPLDANYPEARIAWICAELGIRAMVTQTSKEEIVTDLRPRTPLSDVVWLDLDDLGTLPGEGLGRRAASHDVAYIIFTSGTTGTPKGVVVQHRPAINLIEWVNRTFGVGPADRLLFLTSLCFDLSVYDVFGILAAGGCVRVGSDAEARDPETLLSILLREPITFWDTAPAALQQLTPFLPSAPPEGSGSLRLVFQSGDWIPLTLPDAVRRAFPAARVISLGGATEATVWSNVFPVGDVAPAWASIPYGRPIQNARYLVLNRALEPCPIGVAGDLYIGGECLFEGYAREPRLTADKLVPDPFAEQPGSRLYRTGDRARFWADGNIEFLGRADHQVKVRGFRIELGEIEAVLGQHPAVRAAVALVREDQPGDRRLVAYLVPAPGEELPPAALRAWLQERLPAYMVPSAFVVLDALPVTANGKLDRKALPAPDAASRPAAEVERVAPRTAAEQILAAIWADVLRLPEVGVHDNFFELGGDSILSIQVISRAGRAGLRLNPRQIFEQPTVAGLAAVAAVAAVAKAALDAESEAEPGPVPLTPAQRWLLDQDLPHPEHFNQALLLEIDASQAGGSVPARIRRALAAVLEQHAALRLRFRLENGTWVQESGAPAGPVPFVQVDLGALSPEARPAAVEAWASALQASLDLTAGPLLRAALFTGAEDRWPHRLLLVIHHLVVDGVSWRILLEDLETLWHQLELPPATTSFRRWAERLSAHARSEAVAAEAAWWREALQRPPVLPVDLPREAGGNLAASARSVTMSLDADKTRSLLQEVPRAYRTQINDVLLTALVEAFGSWTGSRRLLLDLEGHGREELFPDVDLSRTVGWFTAFVPVLLDAEGAASPGEDLKIVKEQLRAIPGRGLGNGLLRYLTEGREAESVRALPRPEVLFNYLGQLDGAVAEGRLFRPARESAGPMRDPRQPRAHLLEINGGIRDGRLQVHWTYSADHYRPETVERLALQFQEALERLVAHCLAPGAGGYTPSDFPLARLDAPTLDLLAATAAGPIEDVYPVSAIQQGLLFHSLHTSEAGVYLGQLSLDLGADLDVDAFMAAWRREVERQPILRTSFFGLDREKPLQVVHREVDLAWEHHDWRGLSAAERRERLDAFLAEDRRRGFDVSRPPLLRLALLRLGDEGYRFVWSFHFALLDGWSMPILLRELFALYQEAREGTPAGLERPRTYRDYVEWLEHQDLTAAERFWRRALAGFTAPTPLALPRPEGDVRPTPGVEQTTPAPEAVAALRAFARRHQLTLNTLVQGAWALLLRLTSGEDDVVFGAVTSGRSAPVAGIESILGLFINTLPARVRTPAAAPVLDWLRELQEQQAEVRQHEHSPLAQVQRWSAVTPGQPLFESILIFENYPVDEAVRERAGHTLGAGDVEILERTSYPLSVFVAPAAGLSIKILYDTGRFDRLALRRLLGHFETLLLELTGQPGRRVGELSPLAPAERHQLLAEWNDTGVDRADGCLNDLIEAQVDRTPDAVAVVFEGDGITYAELDRRANQLAHHLRRLGVGPDTPVGIAVERSLEMVVGLLGILKAGGAYVPLDPSYPKERLRFLIEDALGRLDTPVLLTQERLIERLGPVPARLVRLDADRGLLARERTGRLRGGALPESLAYVIHTSGSTGNPKGAMNTHRAIRNRLLWMQEAYGLDATDRVLQKTPFSFDVSVWELFWPLMTGATLVMARPEGHRDGGYLVDLIAGERITTLHFVPSMLQVFLEEKDVERCVSVRRVIASGEALSGELWRRFSSRLGAGLHNLYGPTEAAVDVTFHACAPEDAGASMPIGRPIANLAIHLLGALDAGLQPAPVGVPAELYIGGEGLARGYLGRPELTAERFVPNPWSGRPGERLYRTGDLARRRPDGEVEYLGRLDFQIKIRGVRIELGEIEAALERQPEVREAVVLAREEAPGDVRLIAYVVPDPAAEPPAPADGQGPLEQWRDVFDEAYRAGGEDADPAFNVASWNSAFTGQPIPGDHMLEWVETTVARIVDHSPGRVLEIGCGTGLLLFRIAPGAARYVGTDISPAALDWIGRHLPRVAPGAGVELRQTAADDFTGVAPGSFDAVVLNSVAQYFPSVDYLLRVLAGAVEAVEEGGFVFVGDVRSLPLLRAFHAGVQLERSPASLDPALLPGLVEQRVEQEHELVIDPALFAALPRRLPRVGRVEIQLRRGRHHNELTGFRYDVILHVGPPASAASVARRMDWNEQGLSTPSLRQILAETAPDLLVTTGIPNTRVQEATALLGLLAEAGRFADLGALRAALPTDKGVDPEDLWALGDELGYTVEIRPSAADAGSFDALFRGPAAQDAPFPGEAAPTATWSAWATNPRRRLLAGELVPRLRGALAAALPEVCVPSAFVVLDALPLTPSGKADRRALARLGTAPVPAIQVSRLAPRTPVEELVAGIYAAVLQVERVGAEDSFFELGGHSLLATQVIARLRGSLGVELSVRALFEAPAVAALAAAVERSLRAADAPPLPPIRRAPRDGRLPLSFAQQRLWFLDQMEPGGSTYNVPAAVRLEGPRLDAGALGAALTEIFRRHEALRTTFRSVDGEPMQVIAAPAPAPLPRVDLRGLPEPARGAEVLRLAREDARRPFDLSRGPLLRMALVALGRDEHVALINMHHIVSDAWSLALLVQELVSLYGAFSAGLPSPLAELPFQYADFAAWQRQWLAGPVLDAEIAYWRGQLAGAPPVLELPTDRPRPPAQSYRGGVESFHLTPELTGALRLLSRTEGVTLYMTLAASLQAFLGSSAGQRDFCMGSPVAGRRLQETEGLIGFFINNLVLRADLSGEPTFRQLLGRVRETALAAYAHQDLPFEKIVEELQPERDLSHAPIFQVTFTFQNAPEQALSAPGLRFSALEVDSGTSQLDLLVMIFDRPSRLDGEIFYNSDLFDAVTVRRWIGHLRLLLESAVAAPGARLAEILPLPAAERHQILAEWSTGSRADGEPWLLHERVAAWAAAAPAAPAVVFADQTLTYGELDQRSNQLARYLRNLGVGPDVPVGLCTEPSLETVVGLLGVLKAGGAYIPLDPSYPGERLGHMVQDSGVMVLLGQEGSLDSLPGFWGFILRLDADWPMIAAEDDGPLPAGQIQPDHLADILYTSGSTGQAKGVMVTHRGLANLCAATAPMLGLAPGDRVLQLASLSFDVATWEISMALSAGATLCLAPRRELLPGPDLLHTLREQRITVLVLVASTLAVLPHADLPDLRTVVVGGEACPPDLALRWGRGRRLVNSYGPTETTVCATAGEMEESGGLPLGWPILGVGLHVLGTGIADRRTVPIGVAGELHIAGEGLARGYLNRPDLTAASFLPHPWSAVPGARLYRTGDSARYLPDGRLEFLGRVDNQVKIRGFRIELGEIEAALAALPEVGEAAVLVREDPVAGRSLLAAVAPAVPAPGGVTLSSVAARERLRTRLPGYMVPSAFVFLDALPRLPNGKVDREALALLAPAPDFAEDAAGDSAPPRTPAEERLAALFAEVLQVDSLGVETSFFEVGGHSLLATRLVSRMRDAFGVELPVSAVFDAPTVRGLAGTVEQALRVVGRWLKPSLEKASRDEPLPLSFAQQRLWFLDQMEPGNVAYSLPAAVLLGGPLDAAAVDAALAEIGRRHETLRTSFAAADGEPVQVIAPELPFRLARIDLRSLPEPGRLPAARALAEAEARRPFDLARGPLVRATLLLLAEQEHALLLTMHHIVSDGWSMGVLLRELGILYGSFSSGLAAPLPDLPVQYADFAVWQRRWLTGDMLAAELAWWRGQLGDSPPALELPTDRPRPAVYTAAGGRRTFALPADLLAGLHALGQRLDATPFITLLAAFQALLGRWAGQADFLVGAPVAGRDHAQIENLIGFFVNTLVLRADLSGDPDAAELIGRTRQMALAVFAHQDLPFEKLVAELRPERSLSRTPLFQVVLAHNPPMALPELPGLAVRPLGADSGTTKFDLTLILNESPEGLLGLAEFNRDLFDEVTVERLLERFGNVLRTLVDEPGRPLSALPMLTAGERSELAAEQRATVGRAPVETCLHRLFEEQARSRPEAEAVRFEEASLTYGELNARANRLARRLRRLGVGPDAPVALCAERSLEMVVGLLAILKAGGGYVPLDPTYPRERLSFMLEDALGGLDSPVLLTQAGAGEGIGEGSSVADRLRIVLLDEDPACESAENLLDEPAPEGLAYVIYTSGSTGRPKGVPVTHANVIRLFRETDGWFGFGADDVWTLFHSYAFDFSVWELWGALLYGGRLVVVPWWVSRSPDDFYRLLADEGVTVLNQTPSAFAQLVRADAEADPELRGRLDLRWVIFGGEAVSLRDLAPWFERHGDERPRLVNMYGITETTVHVTWRLLGRADLEAGLRSPIGVAIPDLRLHLLDGRLEPVPFGASGEIYVGGAGLARGYLGRPELAAERFLPDPFAAGEPGARLYRTGDLARRLPDGGLDFLGRADHQVKIRGFRIELGEIGAVLEQHPAVREAVVVALKRDQPGEMRLAAWYVPRDGAGMPGEEVRGFLKARLPEHMVPALLTAVEALPRLPNGKVDRKSLEALAPAPERSAARTFEAPRTPVEELLAGVFADVLELEQVSATDDFFDLGGHSLTATRLVSRVRDAFAVDVQLRDVFEAPTVARLAGVVEQALRAGGGLLPEPIERAPRTGPLPLSFAQQRLWFLDQLEPGSAAYNIPVAVRLIGSLEPPVLAAALAEIVRRHEALRTTFGAAAGEPAQEIAPPARVPLPVMDLSGLPAAEVMGVVRLLAQEEADRPFDLLHGPLLRVALLALGGDEHVLLLTLHHIVSDAWSMGVLLRELGALYPAFAAREASPLLELPVQYADFAHWQRRRLAGEALDAEVAWWRRHLADLPPTLDIATDRPRPAFPTFVGARHPFTLPAALTASLRELSRRQGATLYMTLLAGFQALLARLSGQDDLAVGTPVAGRSQLQTESLIGFFLNTLVLRTDLAGDPHAADLLARVRESTLASFAHQEVPFEKLVEELQPVRRTNQAPLFQVMFVLQNAPLGRLALPGLALEPLTVENRSARFDLTLFLSEEGEGVAGSLEYSTDLFEAASARRMAEHFGVLLAGLAADPDQRLSRLPLLGGEDRAQVLAQSGSMPSHPWQGAVHELIALQAERTPEAPALLFLGVTVTYGELVRRAGRLARGLIALGVRPEDRVGLAVQPSPDMIVGMLGILAAGAAYVPLDPALPAERLLGMMTDAGVEVLVTQERFRPVFSSHGGHGARLVVLDDGEMVGGTEGLLPQASPEGAAYVIYTSGSTGTPKGVVGVHGGLANFTGAMVAALGLGAGDRVLQFASIGFDASMVQIFPTLVAGATLVLDPDPRGLSTRELLDLCTQAGVTVLDLPAALWRQWVADVNEAGVDIAAPIRFYLTGGESVPTSILSTLARRMPAGAGFLSSYGPTEGTVTTSAFQTVREEVGSVTVTEVPLGDPLPGTRLYLLDEHLEPVPQGVPGEICIGGAGVTRGYLGLPVLTADRFVPDPVGSVAGGRLYRTGDLARRRSDGSLQFLGRRDQQVKIRGHRVELGEVEVALAACPGVREGVVLVREETPGDRRLVAYVVPEPEAGLAVGELRARLAGRLPEAMIPSAFVVLPELPRLPSGKLDRRSLPAPDREADTAADPELFVAPRTPTEEILCRLCAELLGLERFGVHDDFFALGGHSLLATRLVGRTRAELGAELPLRAVFEARTVARLAEVIGGAGEPVPDLAPIQPAVTGQMDLDQFLAELEGTPR